MTQKQPQTQSMPLTARPRKHFTLAKALRALPLVRNVMQDVTAEYARMLESQEMLEKVQRYGPVEELQGLQLGMTGAVDRLRKYMEELDDAGVEVRDYRQGRVDFPCMYRGKLIYLCWQVGQETIENWYDPTGDARAPIATLNHYVPAVAE